MVYVIGKSEATEGWVKSTRQKENKKALEKRFKAKLVLIKRTTQEIKDAV